MLETLFFKLLEISIQASFFILAIIFIRLCFKRLPKRYVCILWGLVALRLLLPVQISSEFSLVPDTSRVQNWAEMEVTLPQNMIENADTQDTTHSNNVFMENQQSTSHIADDMSTNTPSAGNVNIVFPDRGNVSVDTTTPQVGNISAMERLPQDDISSIDSAAPVSLNIPLQLSILWCAGMCVLLGYGLISYLRTKLQLREAIYDTENIWYCDGIPSPFVMGYVKPRIYIPFSVEKAQLPYIIAHEKSHIAHFDHLGKLLGYVLLCVYWFNPFIWMAYVLYCRDLELACDERVINKLGDSERKPYSQALLTCSVTNRALLQSPLAFSEVAIKERIINILNYKKPGFWGVVLATAICVIAGVCFMTSPENAQDVELRKVKAFIETLTPEELSTVTQEYNRTHAEYNTADPYSLEGLYLLDKKPEKDISLYGLSNHKAMIIKDGGSIYPLYMTWLDPHSITPQIFKGDYDKDGTAEYALYTLGVTGTGVKIYSLTVLEVTNSELTPYLFEANDIQEQLSRITYEYLPNEHGISIRSDYQHVLIDVAYLEKLHQTTVEHLVWGKYIDFEEHDGQWWISTDAGVIPKDVGALLPDYSCGAVFSAPVIYSEDHSFQIGEITTTPVNAKINAENNADILTVYADQLEAFPGKCSLDEAGNLVTEINVTDYECAVTTSSYTGETVYHWSGRINYNPTSKTYPLEIQDGIVQEVPAEIITEKELLEYAFGKELMKLTYQAHPYGIKQYILRENGIIHVNIGYENDDFLNLQYMTFEISEDKRTATLANLGEGYYLLQVNDLSGLKAFRETFTGKGHMLPDNSTQLPWKWLVAMNGEEYYKPQLNVTDVPAILHDYDFEDLPLENINDWYNGFYASEIRGNDTYYTEFRYQDGTDDIILLTDNDRRLLSITFNGQEKQLPEQAIRLYHGTGGAHGVPYYTDVTGDGIKELIFQEGYRTDCDCYVYRLDTMEQLVFDKDITNITSQLNVTLTEFNPEEGRLRYKIEYQDQTAEIETGFNRESESHAAMLEQNVTLEDANHYFSYIPLAATNYIAYDYDIENQSFETQIFLGCNNIYFEQYIGALYADYVWDADAGQFVIDLDTVTLAVN